MKVELDVPRTHNEMIALRAAERIAQQGYPANNKYTCDDCPQAHQCVLAFDSYNIDGDCLAEK